MTGENARQQPQCCPVSDAPLHGLRFDGSLFDGSSFDYDVIVVGAGYGGFDAAKHAADHGLRVAIVESRDMGGTCVNRGCVPSKALLAASGRVRELADAEHLAGFGIHAAPVRFERQKIADHANQLVATIRSNLTKTLERAGATILRGQGRLAGHQQVWLWLFDQHLNQKLCRSCNQCSCHCYQEL